MADDTPRRSSSGASYNEGYQLGQRDALVRMVQQQLEQLNGSLTALSTSVQQLREGRVTREEFNSLVLKIEGLSRWQWMQAGGLGLFVFLSQILPKLLEISSKKP